MAYLRSSRLAGFAGAVAVLSVLIGGAALAQKVDPLEPPEGLRASIDDNLDRDGAEPTEEARRDGGLNGRIPRYGRLPGAGAGRTGYISTNAPRRKPKKGAHGAAQEPAPLLLGPDAAQDAGAPQNQAPPAKKPAAAPPAPPPRGSRAALANRADVTAHGAAPALRQLRKPPPEDDPFAPVGLRAGAFLLRPALELTTGYDTNPARSGGGRGSSLLIAAPELKVNSDWERHELTAKVRGSYSEYPQVPFANRPFLDAKVDGRIDVSRETRLDLEGRILLSTDNPGSPNLPADLAKLPVYTDVGGTAGIDRRFNRLDLSLKGAVDRIEYQDSVLTDGSTFSNKDRDYVQYGAQARAGYEITPGLKPFVELDTDARIHDLAIDSSGFARDSEGITPRIGTTFELTRKLTGEISIGYLTRTYKDSRLPDLRGLIADGSLVWTATGLTTVKLTAKSTAEESTLPGVSGLFRREAGIEIGHAFRRWLIGTVKVGWGLDDYVGFNREDRRYSASLALVYKLSRTMQLTGELRKDLLRSNVAGADYTATTFLAGMRLQR
jgi:hypothetical protein